MTSTDQEQNDEDLELAIQQVVFWQSIGLEPEVAIEAMNQGHKPYAIWADVLRELIAHCRLVRIANERSS